MILDREFEHEGYPKPVRVAHPNLSSLIEEGNMKRALGITMVVLALALAVVPTFTDCLSQGKALTTTTGAKVPMKCHWTGIAEIGAAVPLALAGIVVFFTKKKETKYTASLVGAASGTLAILFPTALIGVCANPDMTCNMIMRPTLIAAGILGIAASALVAYTSRAPEAGRMEVSAA